MNLLQTSVGITLAVACVVAVVACGDGGSSLPTVVSAAPTPAVSIPTTPAPATSSPAPAITVKVIGFNDFHGNLESPGAFGVSTAIPVADRPAVGGAEYIAGHVAKLKSLNPLNVVVGAGDLIGATPLISALFNDEPAVEALNRIGLEFSAVGNHEFDKGATELLRLQKGGCKTVNGVVDPNSCRGAAVGTPVPFEGAKFQWLAANVFDKAANATVLPSYGVKTFSGVPVAFIGMTLQATPTIVSPAGVNGLEFRDEAKTVNDLIPELKTKGIESIVVLIHEGGFQTGALSDINGCEGDLAGAAIATIVSKLSDAVDLVVSGHTHSAYNCKLKNSAGRTIPVTSSSAFGRVLTDIDLTIDPVSKNVSSVSVTNRLIARNDVGVTPDGALQKIVSGYGALVSPLANQVIGAVSTTLPNAASDVACNMPAGSLIADAQLAATSPASFGGAQIAFMNRGGVRSPGFNFTQSVGEGDGNITYGEAFTVQPFGNSLVTMTMTAQDLKNVLEEQFAGCRGQSATATRIMIPSAGFRYQWDGSKACDARISDLILTSGAGNSRETLVSASGTVLNPTKTYRVTVNSFMATGGDGYSSFLNGKDSLGGAQDIDALVAFLSGYKLPRAPYALGANPVDSSGPRINRIGGTACPTGANVNP
jgi:5'-nucleotidase